MVENLSSPVDGLPGEATGDMREMLKNFAAVGRKIKRGGNRPILLNDEKVVRLVSAGQVDIFATRIQDSDPIGRRLHVARVQAGHLLLGFSPESTQEDMAFIAVSGPETELIELTWEQLREPGLSAESPKVLVELIENWVEDLSAELSFRGPPPMSFVEIEPGQSLEFDDCAVMGVNKGLVWVTQIQGNTKFMGYSDMLEITPGQIIPICPSTWLVASGHAQINAEASSDLFAHNEAPWTALKVFHSLLSSVISLQQKEKLATQSSMLIREEEDQRRLFRSALDSLSGVIVKKKKVSVELKGDPLFDACQLVGAKLGITMRQGSKSGTEKIDPLRRISQASQVRFREVLLRGKWWQEDHGALLGFMVQDGRPVALLDIKPGVYMLRDPQQETQIRVTAKVAAEIGPMGYSFHIPFPDKPIRPWDLIRFGMRGCKADLWRTFGMAALVGILSLITPIATGILLDDIIPSEDRSQLLTLVVGFIVAAICMTLFQLVQAIAQLRIEGKTSWAIQSAVWDRLLDLPVAFFRKYAAGDLANRSLGIDQMRQVISGAAVTTVISMFFSVFQVGLLFFYSLELAIVAIVVMLVSLIIPFVCFAFQFQYQRPLYDLIGKIQAFNLQVIIGIAKLRVNAAERRAFNIWATSFSKQKELAFKSGFAGNVLGVVARSLSLLGTLVMFAWVFWSGDRALHSMTSGEFLAFVSAFTTVLSSAHATLTSLYPMMSVQPLYERTKPILETLPEVRPGCAGPGELRGSVELVEISFRYSPDSPLIIKKISLEIRPRQFVAFVGPSGSGKSTLLRLLLGFEPPESGAILYDRQDLSQLDVQAVRRQIGVVLQNGTLFAGSIFENIVGSSLLTMDDAWEAARMVHLDEDINAMPMGMQTVIGEGGDGISGGQRQRLLVARAIVRRPAFLFFDEATSALDNQSQAWVSRSLDNLKATRIVIAHRLSTIRHADLICVIMEGEITEMGTYDTLMSKEGLFSDLAKRQLT